MYCSFSFSVPFLIKKREKKLYYITKKDKNVYRYAVGRGKRQREIYAVRGENRERGGRKW